MLPNIGRQRRKFLLCLPRAPRHRWLPSIFSIGVSLRQELRCVGGGGESFGAMRTTTTDPMEVDLVGRDAVFFVVLPIGARTRVLVEVYFSGMF